MLSYQHGYHAGNFADVVKHLTLSRLLTYLTQKDKPLFYLETHSGKGLYNLNTAQANKTKEYKGGIELLMQQAKSLPVEFKEYLAVIRQLNPNGNLQSYPGSPYLTVQHLRAIDRMYFCELHPQEFQALQQLPTFGKKVHVAECDGIAKLNALLPPPEKRGLIFIDPSYEIKDEYKTIPKAIQEAYKRFPTGVYCLWYPIVNEALHRKLLTHLKHIPSETSLRIEFKLDPLPPQGMTGCGLWIINPPYTLEAELRNILKTLSSIINPESSEFLIES